MCYLRVFLHFGFFVSEKQKNQHTRAIVWYGAKDAPVVIVAILTFSGKRSFLLTIFGSSLQQQGLHRKVFRRALVM